VTNEQYLEVSYGLVALATVPLAWAASRYLRQALLDVFSQLNMSGLKRLCGRIFGTTFWLVAMAGFASVSYKGCRGRSTYEEIIESRQFLVSMTLYQLEEIALYLQYAVAIWIVIATVAICVARGRMRLQRKARG
jgi:hypothetical protein